MVYWIHIIFLIILSILVLMCQDLSCGTKVVTSGSDDHSLHSYQSVNVRSQANAKTKSKLGQNRPSQNSKFVEAGGGGGTLLNKKLSNFCG